MSNISGGMPGAISQTVFSRILFAVNGKHLDLTLDGDFKFQAGIKPNVNCFTVSYRQFNALQLPNDLVGDLQFYFLGHYGAQNATPDYTLKKVQIVDIEGLDIGSPLTKTIGPERFIKYRLHFADFRANFVSPRGGVLNMGDLNPQPTPAADLTTNSALINQCLTAMGLTPNAPASVDAFPIFQDLKWFNTHAPTALQKMLDAIGHVFCPRSDGTAAIYQIGDGTEPNIPVNLEPISLTLPGIDRRGRAVIFDSAPNAIVNTTTITTDDLGTFNPLQMVAQDPIDHDWKLLADIPALLGNPIQCVNDDFRNCDERYIEALRSQCYYFFRLNPNIYGNTPLGRQMTVWDVATGNITLTNPEVMAPIPERSNYRNFMEIKNPSAPRQIGVVELKNTPLKGSVLRVAERLIKLPDNNPHDWDTHSWIELAAGDLSLSFSQEVGQPGPANSTPLQYFTVGFMQTASGIQKMDDSQLALALQDPSTIIVHRPSWRLYQQDGGDLNRDELENLASEQAPRYIAGSGNPPKLIRCRGFCQAELDGLVSEITIKQIPAETTFKLNSWWLPSEFYLEQLARDHAGGGGGGAAGGGAYPEQAATLREHVNEGMTGSAEPSVILNQAPVPPPEGGLDCKVKVLASIAVPPSTANRGKYWGGLETRRSTADANGSAETQPEGMRDPTATNCLILNLQESLEAQPDNACTLLLNSWYNGRVVGQNTNAASAMPGGGTNFSIVEIDSSRCGATNVLYIGAGSYPPTDPGDETALQDVVYITDLMNLQFVNALDGLEVHGWFRVLRFAGGRLTTIDAGHDVLIFKFLIDGVTGDLLP